MSQTEHAEPSPLRLLPPEGWGSRMRRARETSRLRPSQEAAAAWMEQVTMRTMSSATISRMESTYGIPANPSRRRSAYLLSILYEVEPTTVDLNDFDSPGPRAVGRLRSMVAAMAPSIFGATERGTDRYLQWARPGHLALVA